MTDHVELAVSSSGIATKSSEDGIGPAVIGEDAIVPSRASDDVSGPTPQQAVIAPTAQDHIATPLAEDYVISASPTERICS